MFFHTSTSSHCTMRKSYKVWRPKNQQNCYNFIYQFTSQGDLLIQVMSLPLGFSNASLHLYKRSCPSIDSFIRSFIHNQHQFIKKMFIPKERIVCLLGLVFTGFTCFKQCHHCTKSFEYRQNLKISILQGVSHQIE